MPLMIFKAYFYSDRPLFTMQRKWQVDLGLKVMVDPSIQQETIGENTCEGMFAKTIEFYPQHANYLLG